MFYTSHDAHSHVQTYAQTCAHLVFNLDLSPSWIFLDHQFPQALRSAPGRYVDGVGRLTANIPR